MQNNQIAHFMSLDASNFNDDKDCVSAKVTERMMRTAVHFWQLKEPKMVISLIPDETRDVGIDNAKLMKEEILPVRYACILDVCQKLTWTCGARVGTCEDGRSDGRVVCHEWQR